MKIPILVIVEGDEYFGDSMVRSLQDEHFEAVLVADGARALETIRRMHPQLIVLDESVPHLTGEEIMIQKERDPKIASIPTIFITKSGDAAEIDRVLSLGAKDYIVKSQFNPESLLEKVKQQLEAVDLFPHGDKSGHEGRLVAPPLQGKKMLWVDVEPDPFLADIISRKLAAEGARLVHIDPDGLMTKRIAEERPNVIFIDVVTSDIPAVAALELIKASAEAKRAPVLVLSNFASDEAILKSSELGGAEFLLKATVSADDIVRKIKAMVSVPSKAR